jgi:hypothetical protein
MGIGMFLKPELDDGWLNSSYLLTKHSFNRKPYPSFLYNYGITMDGILDACRPCSERHGPTIWSRVRHSFQASHLSAQLAIHLCH